MMFAHFLVVFLVLNAGGIIAQLSRNKTELLNWCLDSQSHKRLPGKEDMLHQQCLPWKHKACCTGETTVAIHETDLYNFTLNHCFQETGRNMSDKCRQQFDRNNCFYECEPHIGYWVVQTKRKISNQRFYKVPLCASDCKTWWNECREDLTCAYNWPRNFKFNNGVNSCPQKCITFQDMYQDAKSFCENVWDGSWAVTPDDEPCVKMWFDGSEGNPNYKVAEQYIDNWLNGGSMPTPSLATLLSFTVLLVGGRYI